MGESKGRGWAAPPPYQGRKPMERSFQDAILREDRSRKNWLAAWGGLQKEADDTRATQSTSNPGTYFTTNFPLVSSAAIGQTTFALRKRKVAKAKSWAERHIASSETRRSMDHGWTHEAGVNVEKGCAVAPPRNSFKRLGNTKQLSPSEKKLHNGTGCKHPRGTRASTFNEPLNANTDFITTVDFGEALKSERISPSRPTSSSMRTPSDAPGPRASSGSQQTPQVNLLKTVSRRDPRVGYVTSIWAATGQGLAAAIPELPKRKETVRPIESTYSGWTLDGAVTYNRARSQVLSGVSKHQRKVTEFNLFQAY